MAAGNAGFQSGPDASLAGGIKDSTRPGRPGKKYLPRTAPSAAKAEFIQTSYVRTKEPA